MVVRILLAMLMIALAGGFIFFAGNVIWLGTKEFFKIYGPKDKQKEPQILKQILKEDNKTNNTNNN